MPVFNGESHLGEAIESILRQSLGDFEFLVIDDASTDRSEEIVRSYDDPRIRLVRNESNLKLARSLNKGLALARGSYVARMDADDVSLPRRFEKQIAFLEGHRDVGVCGTWLRTFGTESVPWKVPASHDEILVTMLFQSSLMHPTVLMRKSLFDPSDPAYDESMVVAQDYALWTSLVGKTRFANIPEVLLHYRIDDLSEKRRRYKQAQIEVANDLRIRYLERCGIESDSEERKLHNELARCEYGHTKDFVARTAAWLSKILSTNEAKPFAAPSACTEVLTAKFYDVCAAVLDEVDPRAAFTAFSETWGRNDYLSRLKLQLKLLRRKLHR